MLTIEKNGKYSNLRYQLTLNLGGAHRSNRFSNFGLIYCSHYAVTICTFPLLAIVVTMI